MKAQPHISVQDNAPFYFTALSLKKERKRNPHTHAAQNWNKYKTADFFFLPQSKTFHPNHIHLQAAHKEKRFQKDIRVLKMVQTHYNLFYTYYLVFPKNHNKNYLKTHKTYLK